MGYRARSFWSVMIPTYNARADYLEETLNSILQQDPGPDQMQIEVIDDDSPNGAPTEFIRKLAGKRVTVHCEPRNLELAGIWNRCIERAWGEWVHILHQDDLVFSCCDLVSENFRRPAQPCAATLTAMRAATGIGCPFWKCLRPDCWKTLSSRS
jgi:glycosyltransferase involved in cell wall biosynthesis